MSNIVGFRIGALGKVLCVIGALVSYRDTKLSKESAVLPSCTALAFNHNFMWKWTDCLKISECSAPSCFSFLFTTNPKSTRCGRPLPTGWVGVSIM